MKTFSTFLAEAKKKSNKPKKKDDKPKVEDKQKASVKNSIKKYKADQEKQDAVSKMKSIERLESAKKDAENRAKKSRQELENTPLYLPK